MEKDPLTDRVIGMAIEVHRALGPGLLESAYCECLAHELAVGGLRFEREVPLAIHYKAVHLACAYRMDFLIEDRLILEIKSVDKLEDIHEAQLLTYLRLSRKPVGLLLNFKSVRLRDGILRRVNSFSVPSAPLRTLCNSSPPSV